ncbi:hypothetical protein M5K25_016344 [Dendrobium thyrsiflorum]|uniref:Uncharacterized protein n=1 Tax=Dendrobium thyrsiflorum TaxID=117978 RepID=A0ABD0UJW5_DENTH
MDDGPDQDPMVPLSWVIMVPSLLNQRRWSTQPDKKILVGNHGLLRFDAIGEHTGVGHNCIVVMPSGGKPPSSEGPGHNRLPMASFSNKTVG